MREREPELGHDPSASTLGGVGPRNPLVRDASLAWRLIGWTLGVLAVVGLGTSLLWIREERRDDERELVLRGKSLAHASAIYCVEPLLAGDYPVIDTFVQDLVAEQPGVASVVVSRVDGIEVGRAPGTGITPTPSTQASETERTFSADIQLDGDVLGSVHLGLSTHAARARLNSRIRLLALQTAGTFLLLGWILAWIVKRLVGDPLVELDRATRSISEGNLNAPVQLAARGEIGRCAQTLESMRVSVRTSRDELEARNAELANALHEAEEASRTKSRFIANMSHEVRTPLAGIIGFTSLLKQRSLGEEEAQWIGAIERSGELLQRILGDILDFAKGDAGCLELEDQPFDLFELVETAIGTFAGAVAAKKLTLEWRAPNALPRKLRGDAVRLQQVLLNLLGNAIKFTERGSVELTIRCVARSPEAITLQFEVVDSGIGVPAEAQGALFEPFRQADNSTTRRFGGTGLGLAICKQFVELMGGELELESELAKGTRVRFTARLGIAADALAEAALQGTAPALPAPGTDSTAKTIPDAPVADAPPLTLLLVEDNPVNRLLMNAILAQEGHNVVQAVDGLAAVEVFTPGAFDIILMDCQTPRLDGYGATRAIREIEREEGAPATPIIAVTANALPVDRQRCIDAGMDDFIAKPFTREKVAGRINAWKSRVLGDQARSSAGTELERS